MPLLSRELLDRLWLAWEQRGAALVGHLRPGLPSERIDELTAPLGLRLPIEARTWWEWHDGVDVRLGREGEMGPGLPFLRRLRRHFHIFGLGYPGKPVRRWPGE